MPNLKTPKSLLAYQIGVFAVTFLLYASVHAVRKTIGTVATPLKKLGYTDLFFSYMSSAFMICYACGMVFTGMLGDKFRPTSVLLIACLIVSIISITFGLMAPQLTSSTIWPLYVTFWVLSGFAQSCIWPVEVKLISGWFSKGHSGAVFGIWSANSSVGNIMGIYLAKLALDVLDSVSWTFILPSLILILVASVTYFLPITKVEAGFPSDSVDAICDEEQVVAKDEEAVMMEEKVSPVRMSIWAAWLLPGVIKYSLCYACVKSVNYTLFYWLTPLLEQTGYSKSVAYNITAMNDVGWIFGGLACGYLSDRMGSRAPFVGLFLLISIIPTGLLYTFVDDAYICAFLIFLNGFFCGGAGNVVASAVCTDIGKHDRVRGSADVVGQVAGIVDGVGAMGAAIMMFVVGRLASAGIDTIFYILSGLLFVAVLLISDLAVRETRDWYRRVKIFTK